MLRRTALASSAVALGTLSGCVYDRNDESQITITASVASCGGEGVDVNFDERGHSPGVEQKLDDIVDADEYTETPEYDAATEEIYETLKRNFDSGKGTMRHDSTCYEVAIGRIIDE